MLAHTSYDLKVTRVRGRVNMGERPKDPEELTEQTTTLSLETNKADMARRVAIAQFKSELAEKWRRHLEGDLDANHTVNLLNKLNPQQLTNFLSSDILSPEDVKEILQKRPEPAKNIKSNAGKPVQENEPPQPEQEELGAIQQRGLVLAQAIETIGSLGLDNSIETQVKVAAMHELAQRLENTARQLGMSAINEGKMSQVQLSRILGVAQMTVHRWMKAAEEQQTSRQE